MTDDTSFEYLRLQFLLVKGVGVHIKVDGIDGSTVTAVVSGGHPVYLDDLQLIARQSSSGNIAIKRLTLAAEAYDVGKSQSTIHWSLQRMMSVTTDASSDFMLDAKLAGVSYEGNVGVDYLVRIPIPSPVH